jgi:hypothetical protein
MQHGGEAVITKCEAAHRFHDSSRDPSGLGQWAWTYIQGQGKYRTQLLSVYRPCLSEGTSSVYAQHQGCLDGKKYKCNPLAVILEDLALKTRKWYNAGGCIIIGMDANKHV